MHDPTNQFQEPGIMTHHISWPREAPRLMIPFNSRGRHPRQVAQHRSWFSAWLHRMGRCLAYELRNLTRNEGGKVAAQQSMYDFLQLLGPIVT